MNVVDVNTIEFLAKKVAGIGVCVDIGASKIAKIPIIATSVAVVAKQIKQFGSYLCLL